MIDCINEGAKVETTLGFPYAGHCLESDLFPFTSFFFFLILFIQRERGRSSILRFTPHMAAVTGAGPGCSQELGAYAFLCFVTSLYTFHIVLK